MSYTLLSHSKCGGSVVIDVSGLYKLYAPSFSISQSGIMDVTMDVIHSTTPFTPEYFCFSCKTVFNGSDLENEVFAKCQICGKSNPVKSLVVHNHISTICTKCNNSIKNSFIDDPENKIDSIILEYVSAFGLKKSYKAVPMIKVLTTQVNI